MPPLFLVQREKKGLEAPEEEGEERKSWWEPKPGWFPSWPHPRSPTLPVCAQLPPRQRLLRRAGWLFENLWLCFLGSHCPLLAIPLSYRGCSKRLLCGKCPLKDKWMNEQQYDHHLLIYLTGYTCLWLDSFPIFQTSNGFLTIQFDPDSNYLGLTLDSAGLKAQSKNCSQFRPRCKY